MTADDLARDADSFFAIKALCFLTSDLEVTPCALRALLKAEYHKATEMLIARIQVAGVENECYM